MARPAATERRKIQPRRNDAFDVTPAHLVTGLITEHGVIPATKEALAVLAQRLR
jgi:methylthioribose-1-phosphate isomerase